MKRPANRAPTHESAGAPNGVPSLRTRFFEAVYRLVRYRAWWVLFVSLLLSSLALYAIRDLPIKESLLDLLPQDDPLIEQFKLRYDELQQSDSLVVLLQLVSPSAFRQENEDLLTGVAEHVVNQLSLYPEITSAVYQTDGKIATFKALSEDEQLIGTYADAIDALRQSATQVLYLIGPRLEIYYGNGQQVLNYVSQQLGGSTAQLSGTSWALASYGPLGAPRPVLGEVTLNFSQDEGLSGFAGCNPYTGLYAAGSGALRVSDLGAEQARCDTPENILQQEQLYLTALQNARSYFYGDLNAKSQWLNEQLQTLVDGDAGINVGINIDVSPVIQLIQSTQQFGRQVSQILQQAPEQVGRIQDDVNRLLELLNDLEDRLQTPVPDLSEDGRSLRIVVQPSQASFESLKFNRRVLDLVDRALGDFLPAGGGMRAYVAGSYAFTAESNQTLRVDMFYTTLISIAGIALVFLLTFRGVIYPMLVIIPLSMSAVWTTAWAKYALGGFNLVTSLLPALLLGLGINYGIHFVGRFTEERKRGLSTSKALYETILHKGNAMLSGAITTTLVFLVMMLSQSRGLYEMGVVAGFGVMMSAILTLLVLPSLIVVTHLVMGRWIGPDAGYRWSMTGLARSVLRFRRTVIVLVLLTTVAMLGPASEVRIQFVSEDLMSAGLETQKARAAIREAGFDETEGAGDFFLFFAESEPQAWQLEATLRGSPFVIEAFSVSDYFAQTSILQDLDLDQMFGQGEEVINDLFAQLSGTREDLDAQLVQTEGVLRTWRDRFEQFGQRNAVELINEALAQLLQVQQGFDNLDLRELQRSLLQIEATLETLREVVSRTLILPSTIEGFINELPAELKAQLITSNNEIIVYAQLDKNIYLAGNYERFIDTVNPVTTNYIGMPMIQRQLEVAMERDFWVSTLGAFGLIFLSLLIDFAPYRMLLRAPLLVMLPLGLGYAWMLGGMGLLNLSFNLTNMVISPLLIGIGVDNGIHLLHRYLENKGEPDRVQRSTQSVAMPIVIANLATMAAFGSLLFAATPGLPVLGKSALIGVGSVAFCSLTLLPAVLARRR